MNKLRAHPLLTSLRLFIVCLLTINAGLAIADQQDAELTSLFEQLRTSSDSSAKSIEDKIWNHWNQHSDAEIIELMNLGKELLNRRSYSKAVDVFTEVTEKAPQFAEGWNKLATVNYLMNDHVNSVRNIHKTLTLEPRHFGALSGMGLIFLSKGDLDAAKRAFDEVLKISPQSSSAQYYVDQIQDQLGDPT